MKYLALSVAMVYITAVVIVLLTVCKVNPGSLLGVAILTLMICGIIVGDDS